LRRTRTDSFDSWDRRRPTTSPRARATRRGGSPTESEKRSSRGSTAREINTVYFSAILGIRVPDDKSLLEPYDQIRCRDALLDTLLAVLLYEHDRGELPATLADLAPKYAAEAPRDPYSGGPLRYVRAARLIYSVGPGGIDAGPSEESDPAMALLDGYFPTARIP